ncbi:ABC transporter permease [Abyssisolibacter fermentans]|uniref:ABC transporter permease n=1 Tax=Abyssisolibacter fermentans TaxID=1766203 RepID=UPI000830D354|nr:ABC transporter permease [Abyssisolibacter fermentans]
MRLTHYIKIAFTNLSRRKKTVKMNILIMSIALLTLVVSNTLLNSVVNFIDEYLLNSLDFRTIHVTVSKKSSDKIEKDLAKLAKQDPNILDFYNELYGITVKLENPYEFIDGNHKELGKSFGYLCLYGGNVEHANFILKGNYFKKIDTQVCIVPKKFYPDMSFDISFLKEKIQFIDGESLIGKNIDINYCAHDCRGDKLEVIKTFNYSFKVVGTYDILDNLYEPNDIIISQKDLQKIYNDIESYDIGIAEEFGKTYTVISDRFSNIDKIKKEINPITNFAGGIAREKSRLGGIVPIAKYVLLAGQALGIALIFISMVNIMLTMCKSIKKRTSEIGLLKAFGYRNFNIIFIIGLEALIIGILSYVFAILISFLLIKGLNFGIEMGGSMYIKRLNIQMNSWYILMMALISVSLPLLGSLQGFMYSVRIKPREAIIKE